MPTRAEIRKRVLAEMFPAPPWWQFWKRRQRKFALEMRKPRPSEPVDPNAFNGWYIYRPEQDK